MDAADVAAAWSLLERGVHADEPRIRETQERLRACVYTMAHPDEGRLVPACVQHSVLDGAENAELARLLPLPARRPAADDAQPVVALGSVDREGTR